MSRYDAINQFKLTPEMIAEEQAVDEAIEALKYGKHNVKAKEVEAEVRAEFRARLQGKAAKDSGTEAD